MCERAPTTRVGTRRSPPWICAHHRHRHDAESDVQIGGYARALTQCLFAVGQRRATTCLHIYAPAIGLRTYAHAYRRPSVPRSVAVSGSQASWKCRLIASAGPDCGSGGLSYTRPQHRHHPAVDGIPIADTSVPPGRHRATVRGPAGDIRAPAVCMRPHSVRLSVCPGQVVIQTQ